MTTTHNADFAVEAPQDLRLFESLHLDHVELCVDDVDSTTRWLVDQYGFTVAADNEAEAEALSARSRMLEQGRIRIVLTKGLDPTHRAAVYVARHGDGVGSIGLAVDDAAAALDAAVRRGARPLSEPCRHGDIVTASFEGLGDTQHVLVQRHEGAVQGALPGLCPTVRSHPPIAAGLSTVDHFAVCVESGTLDAAVSYYTHVLGFSVIFEEVIEVGTQAMASKVVQSASGDVTLTLIQPDTGRDRGQIDAFLESHGCAGVQHVAFSTNDIVGSVGTMAAAGVEFLHTPDAYYRRLDQRMQLRRHSIEALHGLDVLMDEDHDGQLFQIFTRSVHPRQTLFFEIIERFGATTFGTNNIRALYEAVESERDAVEGSL